MRQILESECGRCDPLGTGEGHRRSSLGQMWIDENVQPIELQQKARVSDPGERVDRTVGLDKRYVRAQDRKGPTARRHLRVVISPLVELPFPEAALLGVRVAVPEAFRRVMRLGWIEVGITRACAK